MTELLLTFDFPPMGGGIARWMAELAARFPPGELIVSTGTLPGADDRFPSVVDRIGVRSGRLRTLPGLWAWRRRVRALAEKHEVSFAWCGNIRPAGYVAARTKTRDGVPFGILLHGGDLLQLRAKFRRRGLKRAAARTLLGGADLLVANSRWTAALCREVTAELGLEPRRLEVVPLGSDPERFRPGIDTGPLEARLGLRPGRRILTVARLVPHKGIDTAIAATAELRRHFPDLEYLVAGTGPDRDRLGHLARKLGIEGAVRFLGPIADAELPALYCLASVYFGLSRAEGLDVEGFGIAVADAASSGLPVIVGASGGTAEVVRDGETGYRVAPTDVAAIVAATAPLLADPDPRRRLGSAGRRWVETELNWDRVVADLRRLSRSVASSARR